MHYALLCLVLLASPALAYLPLAPAPPSAASSAVYTAAAVVAELSVLNDLIAAALPNSSTALLIPSGSVFSLNGSAISIHAKAVSITCRDCEHVAYALFANPTRNLETTVRTLPDRMS